MGRCFQYSCFINRKYGVEKQNQHGDNKIIPKKYNDTTFGLRICGSQSQYLNHYAMMIAINEKIKIS